MLHVTQTLILEMGLRSYVQLREINAKLHIRWAWQNAHITRHISTKERDPKASTSDNTPPQSRKAKPWPSLKNYLSNLQLLLCAKSFERWPLKVKFFAPDVWKRWNTDVDSKVREGITIELVKPEALDVVGLNYEYTGPAVARTTKKDSSSPTTSVVRTGIHAIDVGYNSMKSHLEKSRVVFDNGTSALCGVCEKYIRPSTALLLVCPIDDCQSTFHLTCLSRKFLADGGDGDAVIPLEGKCPGCRTKLEWSTLTKELSLRIRGHKEVAALFKERRKKEKQTNAGEATASHASHINMTEEDHDSEFDDDDMDDLRPIGVPPGLLETGTFNDNDDDGWVFYEDDGNDDSTPSPPNDGQLFASKSHDWNHETNRSRLKIVIEDSEDDDIEILG